MRSKRFDERSIQSEKIHEIEMINKKLIEMEQEIIVRIPEGDQRLVHEWLELYVRMTSIQNECLIDLKRPKQWIGSCRVLFNILA